VTAPASSVEIQFLSDGGQPAEQTAERLLGFLGEAKRTLDIVLYLWIGTFSLASAMGLLGLPLATLWVVAAMAGVALGGVWSADRPLMLRLTPPDRVGEFYGLYGMVGRFSAISGPVIWAAVTTLTVRRLHMPVQVGEGYGVAALLLMVVLSSWILRRVDDAPRNWAALGSLSPERPG